MYRPRNVKLLIKFDLLIRVLSASSTRVLARHCQTFLRVLTGFKIKLDLLIRVLSSATTRVLDQDYQTFFFKSLIKIKLQLLFNSYALCRFF